MALTNITGHIQTGVIGILLIVSVLGPNMFHSLQALRHAARSAAGGKE
jgi:hypothetical protein